MAEYLIRLIGLSSLISVIGMIAPQRGKKYTRLVCTLCLLCVILSPIKKIADGGIFSKLDIDFSDENGQESLYAEIYNNTIRNATAEQIAARLEEMMVKDLSLPSEEFDVKLTVDDTEGTVMVKEARVILNSGAVAYDPHSIIAYLEEMLGCECTVVYS